MTAGHEHLHRGIRATASPPVWLTRERIEFGKRVLCVLFIVALMAIGGWADFERIGR